jgi:hypothetical protein
VLLEKFLEYSSHIDLDEARHGLKEARVLDFEPSFIVRGLSALHLKLTPTSDFESECRLINETD